MAKKKRAAPIALTAPSPPAPYDPSIPQEPRQIRKSQELWSEYALDDGSVIRIKPILIDVHRAKNRFNAEGNPLYFLKTAFVINSVSPPRLRKKTGKRK
jgi:hypothetical protein